MTRSRHAAVVQARLALTPRTLRLTLGAQSLVGLATLPAQDVEILVTDGAGPPLKRRYTIRHARPASGEIDLDVVRHEPGGPGSRWAEQAQLGSTVEFIGPCGKLELLPADWHLFVGDEASLPAISALCEALPDHKLVTAVVQVGSDDDRMQIACGDVRWVTRDGIRADEVALLRSAVDDFALPNSNGRAYLLGELQAVRSLREALEARGLPRDRVFAKSYWRARSALLEEVSA
jgi:NADPH-dependent ferric siderophore reductase